MENVGFIFHLVFVTFAIHPYRQWNLSVDQRHTNKHQFCNRIPLFSDLNQFNGTVVSGFVCIYMAKYLRRIIDIAGMRFQHSDSYI